MKTANNHIYTRQITKMFEDDSIFKRREVSSLYLLGAMHKDYQHTKVEFYDRFIWIAKIV